MYTKWYRVGVLDVVAAKPTLLNLTCILGGRLFIRIKNDGEDIRIKNDGDDKGLHCAPGLHSAGRTYRRKVSDKVLIIMLVVCSIEKVLRLQLQLHVFPRMNGLLV